MSTATATKSFLARAKAPGAAASRVFVYGVEGVGKSTFGASAPSPIFLAAEDGIRHLDGVIAFPTPNGLAEVYDMFRELAAGGHDRKTLVIDTFDWLEPIIARAVCDRNGWADLESPGYGKGYVPFLEEVRKVLAELDRVRASGIEIILLAHAKVSTFSNPHGADYSRYEPAMNAKAAAIVKQWADFVFFVNFDDMVVAQKSRGPEVLGKGKGVSTGRRVIHTTHAAAWDAKSRGSMPDVLPLEYSAFAEARADKGTSRLVELSATLDARLKDLNPPEEILKKVIKNVGDRTNVGLLERMISWCESEIAKKD
jgi:hypothetical protein